MYIKIQDAPIEAPVVGIRDIYSWGKGRLIGLKRANNKALNP